MASVSSVGGSSPRPRLSSIASAASFRSLAAGMAESALAWRAAFSYCSRRQRRAKAVSRGRPWCFELTRSSLWACVPEAPWPACRASCFASEERRNWPRAPSQRRAPPQEPPSARRGHGEAEGRVDCFTMKQINALGVTLLDSGWDLLVPTELCLGSERSL